MKLAQRLGVRNVRKYRAAARVDSGSGSVLSLALVTGFVALCVLVLSFLGAWIPLTRAQQTADQAALVAADAASGRIPGYPCSAAAEVVASATLLLVDCRVDEGISRIIVQLNVWGIDVDRRAQAGPPG